MNTKIICVAIYIEQFIILFSALLAKALPHPEKWIEIQHSQLL